MASRTARRRAPPQPGRAARCGPASRAGPRRRPARGPALPDAAAARRPRSWCLRRRGRPLVARGGPDPGRATGSVLGVARPDIVDPDWFLRPGHRPARAAGPARVPDRPPRRDRDRQRQAGLGALAAPPPHRARRGLVADRRRARTPRPWTASCASWWAANPFLSGVHWTSGIELGVRLIAWAWIRRLLDGWPGVQRPVRATTTDALRQIRWHQEYLAAFRSRGSSANNHVVAEAAGRLVPRARSRGSPRATRGAPTPLRLLERELGRQHLRRAGSTASWPPTTTASSPSSASSPRVEADARGHPLADATWALLARMLDAAAALVDAAGRPPRQGDGDEGRALVLDDPDARPLGGAARARARASSARSPWWPQPGDRRSPARSSARSWHRRAQPRDRPARRPSLFADAGTAILRAAGRRRTRRSGAAATADRTASCPSRPTRTPTRCRSRCATTASTSWPIPGPTATTASRLADVLPLDARPQHPRARRPDQSLSGGPFLWLEHANTHVVDVIETDRRLRSWSAAHDGYGADAHQRTVHLDDRVLTVADRIVARSPEHRSAWLGTSARRCRRTSTATSSR